MATNNEYRTWSFLALLIGGVLILAGALMGSVMMLAWGQGTGMMPMFGAMPGYANAAWWNAATGWMVAVGLASGALVLVAALRVREARGTATWGAVAVAAGAVSLFAMGGFVIGAVSAIAGGAFAILAERGDAHPERA